jgi:hypothetical protein
VSKGVQEDNKLLGHILAQSQKAAATTIYEYIYFLSCSETTTHPKRKEFLRQK